MPTSQAALDVAHGTLSLIRGVLSLTGDGPRIPAPFRRILSGPVEDRDDHPADLGYRLGLCVSRTLAPATRSW